MMIAKDTSGRKVSGHGSGNYSRKLGGHTPEGTIGRATSSVTENDKRVISETKKETAKKPEFGNFSGKVQAAFADKDSIKEIKDLGQKGVKSIQSALLSNPVSRLASDPLKELQEEMKQIKNAAGTIVKAVTSDTVDFTEPNDTPEKRKFEKVKEGLGYIDEGIRKGADRVKRRLKKIFNHPEWYTKYPEFITSNLNYGVRKESRYFPVSIGSRINYSLTIPQRDGKVSQAYIDQMHALYQKVRGSNTGAFQYAVQDLAAYIECVRSIYALHAKLVRDIQAINNVDFYINRTPYALMRVLGYNTAGTDAIIANKATYVAQLNQLGNTIYATLPLPPQMAVFDRDHYLSKVILEDGKGPKSSLYAYVMINCTAADPYNAGQIGNYVVGSDMVSQLSNLKDLIDRCHQYQSNWYNGTDTFSKIAGDLLKAYGQSAFRPIDVADLTTRTPVVFDEYLLHQLQNSNAAAVSSGYVAIKTNAAIFSVTYTDNINVPGSGSHVIPLNRIPIMDVSIRPMIINTNKSDITGAETLSLTRGNFTLLAGTASTYTYNATTAFDVDTVGTDAISAITAVYFDYTNNDVTDNVNVRSIGKSGLGINSLTISHWAQVDYMPPLFIYNDGNDVGNFELVEDLDTYAFMTRDQLAQFNDTCTLSLYKTVDISDQVNFRAVKR